MTPQLTDILDRAIAAHVFPGAVLGVWDNDRRTILARGALTYEPNAPTVTGETVYDIASITKSVPLACLVMQLVEQGVVSLDDQVIRYLPEIDNEYRETMLIRHLLTYTVVYDLTEGLSAAALRGSQAVLDVLFHSPLKAPPGELYVYTNAPAVLLGLLVERVLGRRLDAVADERLFRPLGMESTTFRPAKLIGREIAPTELVDGDEICGVVHDETARAFEHDGFVAGNAGVFSTAGDLLTLTQMLLGGGTVNGQQYLRPETVAIMHTNQLASIGQAAGLGWEMGQARFMGTKMSAQGFGKTGFTGTLILCDPAKDRAMVLLSNRTYPDRPSTRDEINGVRAAVADVMFRA